MVVLARGTMVEAVEDMATPTKDEEETRSLTTEVTVVVMEIWALMAEVVSWGISMGDKTIGKTRWPVTLRRCKQLLLSTS